MKKPLDESALLTELQQGSVFFQSPSPVEQPASPVAPEPAVAPEPSRSRPSAASPARTTRPTPPSAPAAPTATGQSPDLLAGLADPLLDLAAEALSQANFLFAQDELERLEDLKLTLRREYGLATTKNLIVRC